MHNPRRTRRAFRPAPESLDDRTLLAAGLGAGLFNGVLGISGTESADRINVTIAVTSRPGRPIQGFVSVNGAGRFPIGSVTGVVILARGGDDRISVQKVGASNLPISIDGGVGKTWVNGRLVSNVLPPPIAAPGSTPTPVPKPTPTPTPAPTPTPTPTPTPRPTPTPSPPPAPDGPTIPSADTLAAWAQRIITLTNQQRVASGLPALTFNPKLAQAAQIQASQMATQRLMQHTLPNAAYPDLASRGAAVGYQYAWLGENLAFNFPDPDSLMAGWMQSSGHRSNILDTDFTEIGAAVVFSAEGFPYFAEVFGRPQGT